MENYASLLTPLVEFSPTLEHKVATNSTNLTVCSNKERRTSKQIRETRNHAYHRNDSFVFFEPETRFNDYKREEKIKRFEILHPI